MQRSVRSLFSVFAALVVLANCGGPPANEERAQETIPTVPQETPLGSAAGFKETQGGFSVSKRNMFAHVENNGALSATRVASLHSLRFAPSEVTRGGTPSNGSEAVLRGVKIARRVAGAEELIESRAGEIEVSWTFAERPEGEGDLTVSLPLFVRSAVIPENGALRFPREQMRVGRASWVDAAGRRTDLPARFHDGAVRFVVPDHVVRDASYPAVLDPTIFPEHEIDPASTEGLATQRGKLEGSAFSAAFGGSEYLVGWYDTRSYRPRIMAARISQSGAVLDKGGIVVAEQSYSGFEFAQSFQAMVIVHSKNGGYLILWVEPSTGGAYTFPIAAIRMKDDGTVVGEKVSLGQFSAPLFLGATEDSFVMLGAGSTVEGNSYAQPVLDAVYVSGASQPASATRVENAFTGAISSGGGLSTLVSEGNAVTLLNLEPGNGMPFNVVKKLTFRNGAQASVVTLEATDKLSTNDFRSGRVGNHFYAMSDDQEVRVHLYRTSDLAKDGEVVISDVDNVSDVIGDASSVTIYGYSNVAGSVQRCTYDASFVRVGACVPQPDWDYVAPTLGTSTYLTTKALTPSPTRGGQVSVELFDRATDANVFGPAFVTTAVNSQRSPAVSHDATTGEYFAVWADDRKGDDPSPLVQGIQILGTRIAASGAPVGETVEISPAGRPYQGAPKVVSLGASKYFVVWEEVAADGGAQISGVVAELSATITIGAPVVLARTASATKASLSSPTVLYDGVGLLVGWIERSGGNDPATQSAAVYAKRLSSPTQAEADAAKVLLLSGRADGKSRVTLTSVFDGKQSVLVWNEAALLTAELVGITFAPGAALPDSLAFPVATEFGFKQVPSLSTDGKTGSLLVWQEFENASSRNIYGKLLSRDKVRPDDPRQQITISHNTWDESDPAVAYANDGTSYFVAWSDRRNPASAAIYGNWVTNDGRVLSSSDGELISGSPEGDEEVPFATTGAESTVGLVYNRYDRDAGRGALRAHFRTARSGQPNGTDCGVALDCASRLCVDGICCNSSCTDGCGTCAGPSAPNAVGEATRGRCSPYKAKTTCGVQNRTYCDGVSPVCKAGCTSNDDCALPSLCIEGMCSGTTATCADETHVAITTGEPVGCGNYRCVDGACTTRCDSVEQCAPGLVCNFEQQCVVAPTIEGGGEGGCSFAGGTRGPLGAGVGVGIAGVLTLRRMRRTSTRQKRR